jgi:hypothetical protein
VELQTVADLSADRPLLYSKSDLEAFAVAVADAIGPYVQIDEYILAATLLDFLADAGRLLPPSAEHREEHGMQDRTGKVYPMRDAGDAAFTIPIYVNVGGRHVTRTVWSGPWVEVDRSDADHE